jgi:hypothetical protein
MPFTTPLLLPMFMFTDVVLHTPPATVFVSVTDAPAQTVAGPPIAAGNGFTVTVAVVLHPPAVYIMTAVPAATPFTVPVEVTVAVPVAPLPHVPPVVVEESVVVPVAQRPIVPVMADGDACTVILLVTVQPVPSE